MRGRGTFGPVKRNVVANYAGQAYLNLAALAVVPSYLKYLGAEAYGLVGLGVALQYWIQLLDFGLSATVSREVARVRGEGEALMRLAPLVRTLEKLYAILGAVTLSIFFIGRELFATHWLKAGTLGVDAVGWSLVLIGGLLALRWYATLYQGLMRGMERQVWLNAASVVITTLRFPGSVAWIVLVDRSAPSYFCYQLAVSLTEIAILRWKCRSLIPSRGGRASVAEVRRVFPFAGAVAYTSAIWVALSQLDKLLLSHYLTLKEFGYFSLGSMAAAGIVQLTTPLSVALLPRLTSLVSAGRGDAMIDLYRRGTRLMAMVVFPVAGVAVVFAEQCLYAWSGDPAAAHWGEPVLRWYAVGNGILAVEAFQYYLQYAYGKLRMHVWYYTVVAAVSLPLIWLSAYRFGAAGTALCWAATRAVSFAIWPSLVHARFVPGLHFRWLGEDIAPFLVAPALVLAFARGAGVAATGGGRLAAGGTVVALLLVTLALNTLIWRWRSSSPAAEAETQST